MLFHKYKIKEYQDTQQNAVISKGLEIIFPDISHQEPNGQNGHKKCHCHAHDQ